MAEEDILFQDATEALRQDDKAKARDILTRLIKTDQSNVTYWIWLSAAVESSKERIYCLQTALRLDPENATAKRGLVLLGALPPDEDVQPFPLNRPRLWEEKLALESDKPKEKGWKALRANPVFRLAGLGVLGIAVCGLIVFGLILPGRNPLAPLPSSTPAGPSPTFTLTPTFVNATAGPARPGNATTSPLEELLAVPHTPTPLYVVTPRAPEAFDQNRAARAAYEAGNWDEFIRLMEEISKLEPQSVDPYYYIGEAYRFKGDPLKAQEYYSQAIKKDPTFGPPYLGLARTNLMRNANADVKSLLDEAITRDPNFGEVYLERALHFLRFDDPAKALADLKNADRLLSGSPLVYYHEAQAYLALDDPEKALEAAEKARETDPTLLPVYSIIGSIYYEQGNIDSAIENLTIYTTYATRDGSGYFLLGQLYYEIKECDKSVELLTRALALDSTLKQVHIYRGLCYLEAENLEDAGRELTRALAFYPDSFETSLGLMRIDMRNERYGNAYLRGEKTIPLAKTDQQKAQLYYWQGINYEFREEPRNAAEAWQKLLDLPEDAMTPDMRAEAEEHLLAIRTPTPSPTATPRTPTPTPTKTPTPRPGTRTPTPTRTPSPTPTS